MFTFYRVVPGIRRFTRCSGIGVSGINPEQGLFIDWKTEFTRFRVRRDMNLCWVRQGQSSTNRNELSVPMSRRGFRQRTRERSSSYLLPIKFPSVSSEGFRSGVNKHTCGSGVEDGDFRVIGSRAHGFLEVPIAINIFIFSQWQ